MRVLTRVAAVAAAAGTVTAMPCRAQAVDYAELAQMVGEPVTTGVTGKPQRASTAPASVVIVTREQIARSPARSIPDLLKTFAGVDVNRWTAGQSDVAVRGGVQPYNARLLVLVDGRQVYLDHYGMTDWNLIGVPLEAVQQIELVRGPASALYGFNAATGVVNIITVNPLAPAQALATGEIGTRGYQRLSGIVATPLGERVAVKLSGGHRRENERRIPAAIGVPSTIQDVTSDEVTGTIVAAPDAATRIELRGGHAENRQLELLPTAVVTQQRFRGETANLLVNRDTGWGTVNAQTYANWLNSRYGVTGPPPGPFNALDNASLRNRIVVAKGWSLIRIDNVNTARIGVEYRNNQLFSPIAYSRRVGYHNVAVDGMVDVHPVDRMAVTVAARIDRLRLDQGGEPVRPAIDRPSDYDRAITRASFNAALLVDVGTSARLRINGGRGVQSPSLVNFGLRTQLPASTAPIPVFTNGDPRILPSAVWSGELGYDQTISPALHLAGTIFYTRTEDAIASPGDLPAFRIVNLPPVAAVTRFVNAGAFETYGVAVSANGRLTQHLRWLANYSWTGVRELFANPGPRVSVALAPKDTTPEHVVNVVLDYAGPAWFGAAAARYTSSTRQFAFTPVSTLLLFEVRRAIAVDAKLGRHLTPRLDAYAAGENLTDASGAAGSPIPADCRLRLGLAYRL